MNRMKPSRDLLEKDLKPYLGGFGSNDDLRKTPTVVKGTIEPDVTIRKYITAVNPVLRRDGRRSW